MEWLLQQLYMLVINNCCEYVYRTSPSDSKYDEAKIDEAFNDVGSNFYDIPDGADSLKGQHGLGSEVICQL